MVAPSVAGITVEAAVESTSRTATLSGGSGTTWYQNNETGDYIIKPGLDGGACWGGIGELVATNAILVAQWTWTNLGSSGSKNFSTNKFIVHLAALNFLKVAARGSDGTNLRIFSNSGATIYRDYRIFGLDSDFSGNGQFKRQADGWMCVVIDLTDSSLAQTTVGVFDPSTIFGFQLRVKPSAYGSAELRYWWMDRVLSSNGMTLTNGDSGTPGDFDDFRLYSDINTGKGFLVPTLGAAYGFRIPIAIGNGSTATRFEESDKTVIFAGSEGTSSNPQLSIVPANYLGITVNTSASDYIRWTRCSVTSASKWALNISGSSGATFIWTGGVWSNIGTNSIAGAASPSGVIFSGCDRLNFGANRSITNCTITASTDTVAAFDWLTTHTITGTSFTSNTTPAGAIRINAAGTYNLSANTFTGNTKNFNITATTGTVTINVDAASTSDLSWASSYITAGATVVINSATTVTLQVTNCAAGASVSIRRSSDNTSIASGTADGSGIYSTTYSYDGTPFDVVVRARLAGYVPYQTTAQINSGGLNIPAQMPTDPVFVA